jgi:D-alanyl-lipoteichoic acid acyltransferase DltB (MBOAT superfamily)
MGGNRKGKTRTYINLFLTMLIGGLWHGAAWKFVLWGGLHGMALAVERSLKPLLKLPSGRWMTTVRIVVVFHFVAFCWIFFRVVNFSDAFHVLSQIMNLSFNPSEWLAVIAGYKNVLLLIVIGYVLHFFPLRQADKIKHLFYKTPVIGKAIFTGFVFWIVYATASSDTQPFIYFQF